MAVADLDFLIRRGAVSGKRGLANLRGGALQYETGDLFPVRAAIARPAVTATTYTRPPPTPVGLRALHGQTHGHIADSPTDKLQHSIT
jgi:hypothetical protein